jgi:hypothetical protein
MINIESGTGSGKGAGGAAANGIARRSVLATLWSRNHFHVRKRSRKRWLFKMVMVEPWIKPFKPWLIRFKSTLNAETIVVSIDINCSVT